MILVKCNYDTYLVYNFAVSHFETLFFIKNLFLNLDRFRFCIDKLFSKVGVSNKSQKLCALFIFVLLYTKNILTSF